MNRQNSSHNKDDSSNKIAAFIAALGALLVSVEVLSNFYNFWLMIIAVTNLIVIFYLQISVFSLVTTILFVIFYFIYKSYLHILNS